MDKPEEKMEGLLKDHVRAASAYAILSHRWEREELEFGDLQRLDDEEVKRKQGFLKFNKFCAEAKEGYECLYVWADTACINRNSSTELDESIRSMYTWYKNAEVCLVYLSIADASQAESLLHDAWFQRGWTLQELLAPKQLKFFCQDWSEVYPQCWRYDIKRSEDHSEAEGIRRFSRPVLNFAEPGLLGPRCIDRHSQSESVRETISVFSSTGRADALEREREREKVLETLAQITKIDKQSLCHYQPSPANARSVFQWVSGRKTSRAEDMSYCLLGLLDIQIPIAYGEGEERAFFRLQVECTHFVEDRSLFLWNGPRSQWNSMFAAVPSAFKDPSNDLGAPHLLSSNHIFKRHEHKKGMDPSFSLTNCGVRIMVVLHSVKFCATSILQSFKHLYTLTLLKKSDTVVTLLWEGETLSPENITKRWKVAVVGGFDNNRAFAILLREGVSRSPPRYHRLTSAVFETLPGLKSLTKKPPTTVWIQ